MLVDFMLLSDRKNPLHMKPLLHYFLTNEWFQIKSEITVLMKAKSMILNFYIKTGLFKPEQKYSQVPNKRVQLLNEQGDTLWTKS